MTMDDADKRAAKLLPCQRLDDPCRYNEPDFRKCRECYCRPAVAAELREKDAEIEKLKAEVIRLVGANEYWHLRVESLKTEVEGYSAKIEAEAERVTKRDCAVICDGCNGQMTFHPAQPEMHYQDGLWLHCKALKIRAAQAAVQP